MKNIFLIKKTINYFSFGKDSFYFFFKKFYKKQYNNFVNYNFSKKKNVCIKINFFICFKKYIFNETILRKMRFSFFSKNNVIITNHNFLDKIEFYILSFFNKKKKNIYFLNWFKKKNILIKPFLNNEIKNFNFNIYDTSNKFIFINRNFIRNLISKFIN